MFEIEPPKPSKTKRLLKAAILLLLAVLIAPVLAGGAGQLEKEAKSEYSHVRIRRDGNIRSLLFVRDSGQEVIETSLNLEKPHSLISDYTQYMFMSYLLRPKQEKVLIVGLGGGAMVHFLKHYDPDVKVDVVEIDPLVVQLADGYFGVRTEGNVRIETADAFKYLATTEEKYDVIYMDAFLKPSDGTDSTGVPLKLKQVRFYKELQKVLTPGGMVAFNINPHLGMRNDIRTIASAFPQTYVWYLPGGSGAVAVGSLTEKRATTQELIGRGRDIDARFRADISFAKMASQVAR